MSGSFFCVSLDRYLLKRYYKQAVEVSPQSVL